MGEKKRKTCNKFFPEDLFIQITFCFNAWNQNHWLYEHFFKGRLEDDFEYLMTHRYQDYCNPDEIIEGGYGRGVYLHTSTYKINEFRDTEIYDAVMDELKLKAPEIFKVEGLGMWGNTTEATYPEINDSLLRPQQEINKMRYSCYAIGIDTGLSNGEGKVKTGKDVKVRSATTMQLVGLTADYEKLCCINEFFYSNERELVKKTEPQLMEDIIKTIKQANDSEAAKTALSATFGFTDIQAKSIVDMKLGRLAHLESIELNDEKAELDKKINARFKTMM